MQTERIVVATFMAAGVEGLELPTTEGERETLDAWLVSEPRTVDRKQAVLRRALGLGAAA